MPNNEIIDQYRQMQKESAADTQIPLVERLISILEGKGIRTSVDDWVEANEINTEELKEIGLELAHATTRLIRSGVLPREAISAVFSAGFQCGFNVANARVGGG